MVIHSGDPRISETSSNEVIKMDIENTNKTTTENVNININIYKNIWTEPYLNIPESCKYCSNHPNNGGSGICFCTLGLPKIT